MTGSRHARHGAPRSRRGVVVGAVVAGVLVLAAIFAGGLLVGRSTSDAATGAASSPTDGGTEGDPSAVPAASTAGLPTRPTMLAEIVRVVSGDEVVARVGGTEMPIRVLGLDTPDPESTANSETECGSREALEFADRTLSGQTVTLVPDPTVPELDDGGRRLSYVVLHTQLSYTDAALAAGIGRADTSRPLWYSDLFTQEQDRAVRAQVGIWGAPCEARP